ncbi:hypothetical protein Tco_0566895 [Tanacetum coccineum]
MIFPEPELIGQNTYATSIKFPAEIQASKEGRYELGHFKNGSADEQKEEALRKANLEGEDHQSAARYLDFGLEELVPSLWVESEREYDISDSLWHHSNGEKLIPSAKDRQKDLVLTSWQATCWIRAVIRKRLCESLQLGIERYQTKINLNVPNWGCSDYYFKEDYHDWSYARAGCLQDRNDQRTHDEAEGATTQAWENREVVRGMIREKQKDFITAKREKTTDQKDLSKV